VGPKSGAALFRRRVRPFALRQIVEREREIKAFEKEGHGADRRAPPAAGPKPPAFDARFVGRGEEKIEVGNGEERPRKSTLSSRTADWLVRSVERKEARRNATPPFHNQQAAAGLRPQAPLQREAHHDDRPAPV